MTLSINDTWMARAESAAHEVRFLVEITKGATTWSFLDGACDLIDEPVGVNMVAPIAAVMDVLTREIQIDGQTVIMIDEAIRDIIVANRLRGAKLAIKIGFRDIAEANFIDYWTGVIEGVFPSEDRSGVRIEGLSIMEILRQHTTTGAWVNKHPLECILDVLENHLDLDASMIDEASFDPDDAANVAADLSHFIIGHYDGEGLERAIRLPVSAFELIDKWARLLNGMIRVSEAGVISFKPFNASASEADTWTEADISSLTQMSLDDRVVNQVEFSLSPTVKMATSFDRFSTQFTTVILESLSSITRKDTASQTAHAYAGMTSRVFSHTVHGFGLIGGGELHSGNSIGIDASVTSFSLLGSYIDSLSGSRDAIPGPQPAGAKIDTDRPLYLMTNNREIIKVDEELVPVSAHIGTRIAVPGSDITVAGPDEIRAAWTVNNAERGYDGTTAATATTFFDVTIPVMTSEAILKRHAYGVPIVDVRTGLAEWDKEVGDLVKIEWPNFLGFGNDGLSGTLPKWEIISKEYDPGDDRGGIKWRLAYAAEGSPTFAFTPRPGSFEHLLSASAKANATNQDVTNRHISGMEIAVDSGLDATIAEGFASGGSFRQPYPEVARTFTASKDTWVVVDTVSGLRKYIELTIDDPEPTIGQTETIVAKVVTNGTDIVSIVATPAIVQSEPIGMSVINTKTELTGNLIPNGSFSMISRR